MGEIGPCLCGDPECPSCGSAQGTFSGFDEENDGPKYPDIEVQLTGQDGNAFGIMGRVSDGLRRAGLSRDVIAEFRREATSGDYDNLLQTCMRWVTVL